jgi:hypothetical protein
MKEASISNALREVRRACLVVGMLILIGPGLDSKRATSAYWALAAMILFLVGGACWLIEMIRRGKHPPN